ncbi:MAG: sensor domain-containing protein [Dehalococcoidia bacterium]
MNPIPLYPPGSTWKSAIVAPFRTPWTVRRAAYVAVRPPLSIAYFFVMIAGLCAGGALSWTIVGLAIFAVVTVAARWFGDFESQLARHLAGVPFRRPPTRFNREEPLTRQARKVVSESSTWTGIAFFTVDLLIGVTTFVVMVVAAYGAYWLTAGPLVASGTWPFAEAHRVANFGFWRVDTAAEALMLVPVGLAMAVGYVHLVNAWAYFYARWAGLMLGHGPEKEVVEQIAA